MNGMRSWKGATMSDISQSWCESLARRLFQVAASQAAAAEERRRRLLARRGELLATAGAPLPAAGDGGPASHAEALSRDLALRQAELAALAERRRTLAERERTLGEALAVGFAELCARCEQAVTALPLLSQPAQEAWLAWLEEWHRASQRPFEPDADWRRHFQARTTVEDALFLVDPAIERIQRLEPGDSASGAAGIDLAAEVERQRAELRGLEEASAAGVAAAAAAYGRIAADLPDPAGADSLAKLERVEGMLLFIETALGRFAASARSERQMLEALS
jgi:hypothetical protein